MIQILPLPLVIARGGGYRVYSVRWGVFEDAEAEGLLLEQVGAVKARVVAIPDADWPPEMLVGMAPGVPSSAEFARRLAENGCEVLVPVLLNRSDTWSGIPGIGTTNQPHREWIYRMAFETGRTIIGYEVQKVLAAVDWRASYLQPVGVAGYGEGGLLALYAASLDARIQATLVSGYFQPRSREQLWNEPIYRDVWGLLRDFGDAELAGMIVPRVLVVEASRFPEVAGPPRAIGERTGAAPGRSITTPPLDRVRAEVERARPSFESQHVAGNLQFAGRDGHGPPGTAAALRGLLQALGVKPAPRLAGSAPRDLRTKFDAAARLRRQFDQLAAHTQALIRKSELNRTSINLLTLRTMRV